MDEQVIYGRNAVTEALLSGKTIESKEDMLSTSGLVNEEILSAAEVTMTCNIREWKHILSLRCTKHAHPAVEQVMIPLLLHFKKHMPEIFENIEYDTEFKPAQYAEITVIE